MSKTTLFFAVLALAAVAPGCTKHNEIPASWRGRFRRTAAFGLVADQFVTVNAHGLTIENCQFNCGEPTITFDTLACPGSGPTDVCRYTSRHCTGTVSYESDRISITATPTPSTATGPELGTHNQTCWNARVGRGTRAR